jgi:hypothetical protein
VIGHARRVADRRESVAPVNPGPQASKGALSRGAWQRQEGQSGRYEFGTCGSTIM